MLKTGFGRVLLAMLLILAWPAAAQAPQRLGLFAAFSDYTGRTPGWDNLPETRRDASDMRRMFDDWGYQSPAPLIDPSRQRLQDALTDLGRQIRTAPDGSLIVVYISSHGFGYRGDNFVVPSDAGAFDDVNFADKTISVSQILDKLGTRENVTRIVILDMCRNSLSKGAPAFLTGKNNQPMTAPVDRGRIPPSGTLVVYSSGYGQRSNPALGGASYSLFTEIALSKFAQKPDSFFYDVFYEVSDAVSQRTSGHQVPMVEGAARNFTLKPPGPATIPDRATPAFSSAVVSGDRAQLLAFIQEFPDAGKLVASAQKLYAEWTKPATAAPGRNPEPPRTEEPAVRAVAQPIVTASIEAGSGDTSGGASQANPVSTHVPPILSPATPSNETRQKPAIDTSSTAADSPAVNEIILDEIARSSTEPNGGIFSQYFSRGVLGLATCYQMPEIEPAGTCAPGGGLHHTSPIPFEKVKRSLEGVVATSTGKRKVHALTNLLIILEYAALDIDRQQGKADFERYMEMIQQEVANPTGEGHDDLDIIHAYKNAALTTQSFGGNTGRREYFEMAWKIGGCRYTASCEIGFELASALDHGFSMSGDRLASFRLYRQLRARLPDYERKQFDNLTSSIDQRVFCELVQRGGTSCRVVMGKPSVAEVK